MRLTERQIIIIKNNVALFFGQTARVYLFGSRTDDSAKGGDIDLFIELSDVIEQPVRKILQLNSALQQAFGLQKIDILFHAPNYMWQSIHNHAKNNGLLL